jgi:hypothetical protein
MISIFPESFFTVALFSNATAVTFETISLVAINFPDVLHDECKNPNQLFVTFVK